MRTIKADWVGIYTWIRKTKTLGDFPHLQTHRSAAPLPPLCLGFSRFWFVWGRVRTFYSRTKKPCFGFSEAVSFDARTSIYNQRALGRVVVNVSSRQVNV